MVLILNRRLTNFISSNLYCLYKPYFTEYFVVHDSAEIMNPNTLFRGNLVAKD